MLEVSLTTKSKSKDKRLEQINELARHQSILQQKSSYKHVSFDSRSEKHLVNLLEIKKFQPVTIIKKVILNDDQQTQKNLVISNKNGPFLKKKNFIKIQETEQITENERTVTSLPLKNHQNTFFTGQVAVGEKEDSFNIIFDTGSSLTFINSVHCGNTGCQKGTQYDASESDTHEDMGAEVEVEFGSGTLKGKMSSENFYVNGMRVPDTVFIEITEQIGDVFDDGDFDGIVGLSFPDLADDTPTLFDFMIEKEVIEKPLFSFYMNREAQSENSKVIFGGYDEKLMASEIVYHNVTEEYYWSIQAQQIRVGDQDTGLCSAENPCKLVLDSGTSLFTGPSDQLKVLLEHLETEEGCKNLYDLEDIIFVVDGVDYNVEPEEYILTVTEDGVEPPYQHSDLDNILQCVGAFYSLDIEEPAGPLWVLGDVFMSKYYTIFERGINGKQSKIGLAKAKM